MRLRKHLLWIASPLLAVALLAVSLPTLVHASPGPPVVSTTSLADGEVGVAYSQTLAATDGTAPYTWSITAGALPNGLALDAATGAISGTPTTAGTFGVTVEVTDSAVPAASATQALSIVVADPVSITTTSLPGAELGVAYAQYVTATAGVTPYAWSITAGALPNGLALDATSGAISGTPTTAGTFAFTVAVTDAAAGTATQNLTIVVAPAVAIATTSLPNGVAGTAYAQTLAATDGVAPYAWSITAGTLPAGLTLDATTGVISGTPTTEGTTSFTVQVLDALNGAATQDLAITVDPAASLTVTTTTLPDGTIGAAYTQTLTASGGIAPYTWSVTAGALPDGLALDAATGVISGTPTTAGASSFTVQVTDAAATPATATQDLGITVGTTPPSTLNAQVLAACQDTTVHPALPALCRIYTSGQLPPFAQGVIGRVILKLVDKGHPKAHHDEGRHAKDEGHRKDEGHGKDLAKEVAKTQSKLDKKFGVGVFFHSDANSNGAQANVLFGAGGKTKSDKGHGGHGDD